MGTLGQQAGNTSQASTSAPPPWAAAAGQQAIQNAQALQQMPFAIPQQPIAPLTAQQAQGFQEIQNLQGAYSPYVDQTLQNLPGAAANAGSYIAAGSQNPFLPAAAGYQTPQGATQYFGAESAGVLPELENLYAQQTAQNTGNLVQQAGGTGADRIAIGQGQLANQQGLAAGQILSQLMGQSVTQGQQAGMNLGQLGTANAQLQQQAGQGLGALANTTAINQGNLANLGQTMGLSAANAEIGAGAQQQQQLQNQLNAQYSQNLQNISWPFQTNEYLGALSSGVTPSMGGSGFGTGSSNLKSSSLNSSGLGAVGSLKGLGAAEGGRVGEVEAQLRNDGAAFKKGGRAKAKGHVQPIAKSLGYAPPDTDLMESEIAPFGQTERGYTLGGTAMGMPGANQFTNPFRPAQTPPSQWAPHAFGGRIGTAMQKGGSVPDTGNVQQQEQGFAQGTTLQDPIESRAEGNWIYNPGTGTGTITYPNGRVMTNEMVPPAEAPPLNLNYPASASYGPGVAPPTSSGATSAPDYGAFTGSARVPRDFGISPSPGSFQSAAVPSAGPPGSSPFDYNQMLTSLMNERQALFGQTSGQIPATGGAAAIGKAAHGGRFPLFSDGGPVPMQGGGSPFSTLTNPYVTTTVPGLPPQQGQQQPGAQSNPTSGTPTSYAANPTQGMPGGVTAPQGGRGMGPPQISAQQLQQQPKMWTPPGADSKALNKIAASAGDTISDTQQDTADQEQETKDLNRQGQAGVDSDTAAAVHNGYTNDIQPTSDAGWGGPPQARGGRMGRAVALARGGRHMQGGGDPGDGPQPMPQDAMALAPPTLIPSAGALGASQGNAPELAATSGYGMASNLYNSPYQAATGPAGAQPAMGGGLGETPPAGPTSPAAGIPSPFMPQGAPTLGAPPPTGLPPPPMLPPQPAAQNPFVTPPNTQIGLPGPQPGQDQVRAYGETGNPISVPRENLSEGKQGILAAMNLVRVAGKTPPDAGVPGAELQPRTTTAPPATPVQTRSVLPAEAPRTPLPGASAPAATPVAVSPPAARPALPGTTTQSEWQAAPRDIRQTIAAPLVQAGWKPNAVGGLLMAVQDETSGYNPNHVTFNDQHDPKFRGTDAMHGHGIFQEGGDEWNGYKRWLHANGHSLNEWNNPTYQTQYVAERLQSPRYAGTLAAMNGAKTPGEAAAAFVRGYLNPRYDLREARAARYTADPASADDMITGKRGMSAAPTTNASYAPEQAPVPQRAAWRPGPEGYSAPPGQEGHMRNLALANVFYTLGGFPPDTAYRVDQARLGTMSALTNWADKREFTYGAASPAEGAEALLAEHQAQRSATQPMRDEAHAAGITAPGETKHEKQNADQQAGVSSAAGAEPIPTAAAQAPAATPAGGMPSPQQPPGGFPPGAVPLSAVENATLSQGLRLMNMHTPENVHAGVQQVNNLLNGQSGRQLQQAQIAEVQTRTAMAGWRMQATPKGIFAYNVLSGAQQFIPMDPAHIAPALSAAPQQQSQPSMGGAPAPATPAAAPTAPATGAPAPAMPAATPISQQPIPADQTVPQRQPTAAGPRPTSGAQSLFNDQAFATQPIQPQGYDERTMSPMPEIRAEPAAESRAAATRAQEEIPKLEEAKFAIAQLRDGLAAMPSTGALAAGAGLDQRIQIANSLRTLVTLGGLKEDSALTGVINRIADPNATVKASELMRLNSQAITGALRLLGGAGGGRGTTIYRQALHGMNEANADRPSQAAAIGAMESALQYSLDYNKALLKYRSGYYSLQGFDDAWNQAAPMEKYVMAGVARGAFNDKTSQWLPEDSGAWARAHYRNSDFRKQAEAAEAGFNIAHSGLYDYLARH